MTLWSDLFKKEHLISRQIFNVPGSTTINAPSNAAYIRVSMVGAGGAAAFSNAGFGDGAAFARVTTPCAAGAQFTVQVGDPAHSHTGTADDSLGDSIVTRLSDSVVICKAERGHGTGPGLAVNSVGDVKRDGSSSPDRSKNGGASAGDDSDTYSLGFGGRGGGFNKTTNGFTDGPGPGGGGAYTFYSFSPNTWTIPSGAGRVIVDFYDQDPGLGA